MITKSYSFSKDNQPIDVYTLRNSQGVEVDTLTYGARIIRISVPDKDGNFGDVIVGCKTPEGYFDPNPYFGATVGRYGNRIGNATFQLDGTRYALEANSGAHILHGGTQGSFSSKVWKASVEEDTLVLKHTSYDGESGFPGTLQVTLRIQLGEDNGLLLDYTATTDKDTVCNLTNHSYFNLGDTDDILDHELFIDADYITACESDLIPMGDFTPVVGTPYGFKPAKRIGKDICQSEGLLASCNGYDFNYVCNNGKGLRSIAWVYDEKTGRKMEVLTTLPGVQLYTGNGLTGFDGKKKYERHSAFCLETQCYPNSPNCPNFPTTTLRVGETYHETTIYRFSVEK